MDDFPVKFADLLEGVATKVRAITVDRVAQWTKMAALGMVVAVLGLLAVLFLLIGLFRLISSVIGVTPTYAVIAGIFLVGGAFLWAKRTRAPGEEQ
ncbi:MAG: hypothetical protein HKN74_13485 [Acidimicrobiia bacterium]|nr:hypothetical protein [Acidimicrobiia bacterium]MBT8216793.1 hypothetical protein [Acidimicrobiia bacterium]NNF11287.1 hypothetical protein [Acidimicrobiia bacterium]NNL68374.1 hypothetical protein [Acidimicrobiia bacterium]